MARLWEQARRILSSKAHREAQGIDGGFCIVRLKASSNLRSISVRQLSTTLIACLPRVQPLPFAGWILAIGMRRAAASSSPPGTRSGERQETTAAETSGPRFLAGPPGRDHLKLRGGLG